jgi:hypothetical protein
MTKPLYKVSFLSGGDSWLTTNYPSSPEEHNIQELSNPWEALLALNGSENQTFTCGGHEWYITRERVVNHDPEDNDIYPTCTRLSMVCEELPYTLSKLVLP